MAHVIRFWETTMYADARVQYRLECEERGCLSGTVSGGPAASIHSLLQMAATAHEADMTPVLLVDLTPGEQADADRAAELAEDTARAEHEERQRD